MDFAGYIRNIPNHPKPGINFKDITPLLLDGKAFQRSCDEMARPFSDSKIDYVAGIEARGFIFGAPMAFALNAGFIPIRKSGKLPGKTIREEYSLEYGTDSLEIHQGHIKQGSRVIIVDDLLATGGTAGAAANLVRKSGGVVVGLSFLIELSFLKGRNKFDSETVFSLLTYDQE